MIVLVQQPQMINYSQSIPDFKLSTDKESVKFTLTLNAQIVVEEEYDAAPSGQAITIKLKDLIENFMEFSLPIYTQDITVHETGIKEFQFKWEDSDSNETGTFKVLKGFLKDQPADIESYLRDFWLNLIPKHSEVFFHQPLYLTALPNSALTVTVKAKMRDGTDKTISIAPMEVNKLQSVNLNPGRMILLLGGAYQYFDAYAVSSTGAMVTGLKRFYFRGDYEFHADVFFYQNRLGGWDTLILNGQKINSHSNNAETALIDLSEFEFNNELKLEFQKSTGFIATEEDYKQYIDFLFSKNKYCLHEGNLIPIVTSDNKVDHSKGKLNSYSFVFRPSNTRLIQPEIGSLPTHLIIT